MMNGRWLNKNINLQKLVELIEIFLKSSGLSIKKTAYQDAKWDFFVTWAYNVNRFHHREVIQISIIGDSNDFTIRINAERVEIDLKAKIVGRSLSLFGGGFMFLNKLKAQEAFYRWREQFWTFIKEQVANLTNIQTKA